MSALDGILYVQASGGRLWHLLPNQAMTAVLPSASKPALCRFRPSRYHRGSISGRNTWAGSRVEPPVLLTICGKCLAKLPKPRSGPPAQTEDLDFERTMPSGRG